MDNNVLEIIIKAKDLASKTIQDVGNEVEKQNKKFADMSKQLGAIGTAVTGVGVAGLMAMKDWVTAAGEAEAEMAKFEGIMTASFGTAPKVFREMREAGLEAGKAMIKLGFDDETTAVSFAKLASATNDSKEANRLLALSADLARYKGVDLSVATIAVMKATQGSTKELKAMGMEVKEGATAADNLATVQGKVSGQAQNFANTYQGAMTTMKITTDNLREALGERLLPIFTGVVQKVSGFIEKINELNPNILDMIVKVVAVGTGLALIVGPLLMIIGFLPALTAGFALLNISLLPIVLVIAAIAAGAFLIVKNWSEIQPLLQPALDWIIGLFAFIRDGIMAFVNEHMPLFMAAWNAITSILQDGLIIVSNLWNAIWPAMLQLFTGVWNMIKGVFQIVWGAIQVLMAVGLGILTGDWSKAWNLMKDGFYNIFNGLKTFVSGWWESIKGFFKAGLNGLIGIINGGIEVINKAGSAMGVSIPTIPTFDNGGWVNSTGLAIVHKGEYVMSNAMLNGTQRSEITNNNSSPVNVYATVNSDVDIQKLAYALAYELRNK